MIPLQRKWTIIIALLCLCLFFLLIQSKSITTVKYFPINPDETFQMAETNFSQSKGKDIINWTTISESDTPMYLRQDVALLFANGRLKAVQNHWKQYTEKIEQTRDVPVNQPTYFQAIAFHHGEIHDGDDDISSIQHISLTERYMTDKNNRLVLTEESDESTDKLRQAARQDLQKTWQAWLRKYKLDQSDYHLIPLTALAQYETENFPDRTREETDQIIGQLWEGLYKNYVLPLLEKKDGAPAADRMPLLLIAKDNSFLYVLYGEDGEAKLLKQQLPSTS